MAGIFGYYLKNQKLQHDAVRTILQSHSRAGFPHRSESKIFADGSVCLGFAARVNSPDGVIFESIDRRYSLVLCGELFLPSGEQLTQANFQNEFIPHFERKGKELFLACDGAFVLAFYDATIQSVYIVTDPFGNLALHYTKSKDGFIFSSQQKALAEVHGENIDTEGLSEFISLGFRLNGKTIYKNIFRLPPASFITIESSGDCSFAKYYRQDFSEHRDLSEQLLRIEESVLRSVEIRTRRDNCILGLSGGLDSRMTLAAMLKLGRTDNMTAFTHGLPSSGDLRVASKITRTYDIPHLRLIFDNEFFLTMPEYWHRTVRLSEGGLGIQGAGNIISWQAESKNFSVLFDSHGGAFFRRQFHKAREGALRRSDNFIATFFRQFQMPLIHSNFIPNDIREGAMGQGLEALSEYFSSLDQNISFGDKIDLYYLEQLSANKYSLAGNSQQNYIGLSHPLLSLGAYSSAIQIPAIKRRMNIIYRYLFKHFAPELRYFFADDSGYRTPYFGYRALRYLPKIFDRGLRILPRPLRRFSMRRPVIMDHIVVEKNIQELKKLLLDTSDTIFIPQELERSIKDFETGKKDNAQELLQAANLKLLLEYFAH